MVVLTRFELDLIEDFNEDGIDAGANGLEGFLDVLLEFSERGHELAPGVSDGNFQFFDIESERCESLEILFGVADDHF